MKILLVEDDETVAELLKEALTSQHYLVELAMDGKAGWELAQAFEYDLILLDLMLPKLDGISFCRQRRQEGDRTPILLLTGLDTSTNKVMGLDAGADDYVVKPFDFHELLARIRALLRRKNPMTTPIIKWGNLHLNPSNCEVTYNEQMLHLTSKEYALLELFLRNTQRIFSQSALLDHLWSLAESPSENAVRAHIKSLRQKLKKAGASADLIETVYGLGYRLKPLKPEESGGQSEKVETFHASLPPNTVTEATQAQQPITPQVMGALWARFKDKYSDRITLVEQAVSALLADTLSEALRQQALREAHTLVGSLGSFGFTEASRICRQLEQTFQAEGRLNQPEKEHLSQLVIGLRQELGKPSATLEHSNADVAPTIDPTPGKTLPRLLVVDDDVALALALTSEAAVWGMRSEFACDLSQARKAIAHTRPDVVLLDLCFPDSAENAFGLLTELVSYEPPVPVLVFTAQESFSDRVKVARLGGRGFLQKPISPNQVMEAIAQVLKQASTPEAKLLIIDDNPQVLDSLRAFLEPWGFKLTLLDDPQQFWETLEQSIPDLLILDLEMPELSGIDLCQVVRNAPRWSEMPVLFLLEHTDTKTIHQVFTAGADDYINKPIIEPELIARVLTHLKHKFGSRQLN